MTTIEIYNSNWSNFFNSSSADMPNNATFKLMENITITTNHHLILGDGSTFDGQKYKITINVGGTFGGLFKMAYADNKVENLEVVVIAGTTLPDFKGWIGSNNETVDQGTHGTVSNCSVDWSGTIMGSWCGGIVGAYSFCTVNNCWTKGTIGEYGGGIFGYNSIFGSAINCYSIGNISDHSGGIFGSDSGATATNCYSIGDISSDGGGIFGSAVSGATATYCYSIGDISSSGGGIFGSSDAGTATNCYFFNKGISSSAIGGSQVDSTFENSSWKAFNTNELPDSNWSTDHWLVDNSGTIAEATRYFPILQAFRSTPWDSAVYDNYNAEGRFIPPIPTTTLVTANVATSTYGDSISFIANVTSTSGVTGNVVFYDESDLGNALSSEIVIVSGNAELVINNLLPGTRTIRGSYLGDTSFEASFGNVEVTINSPVYDSSEDTIDGFAITANAIIELTANLAYPQTEGNAILFSAYVTYDTDQVVTLGNVTFTSNIMTGTLGDGDINVNEGYANLSISSLSVGSHTITATYNGSTDYFNGNTKTMSFVIDAAAPTSQDTFVELTSNIASPIYGDTIEFTANVTLAYSTAVTSGNVSFTNNSGDYEYANVEVNSAGLATFTINTLVPGDYTIKASYLGAEEFNANLDTLDITVGQPTYDPSNDSDSSLTITANTIVNLTANVESPQYAGNSILFSAYITYGSGIVVNTGNVTFTDSIDGTIGTVADVINGFANVTTSSLSGNAIGRTITATYNGATGFNSNVDTLDYTVYPLEYDSTYGTFDQFNVSKKDLDTITFEIYDGETQLNPGTSISIAKTLTLKAIVEDTTQTLTGNVEFEYYNGTNWQPANIDLSGENINFDGDGNDNDYLFEATFVPKPDMTKLLARYNGDNNLNSKESDEFYLTTLGNFESIKIISPEPTLDGSTYILPEATYGDAIEIRVELIITGQNNPPFNSYTFYLNISPTNTDGLPLNSFSVYGSSVVKDDSYSSTTNERYTITFSNMILKPINSEGAQTITIGMSLNNYYTMDGFKDTTDDLDYSIEVLKKTVYDSDFTIIISANTSKEFNDSTSSNVTSTNVTVTPNGGVLVDNDTVDDLDLEFSSASYTSASVGPSKTIQVSYIQATPTNENDYSYYKFNALALTLSSEQGMITKKSVALTDGNLIIGNDTALSITTFTYGETIYLDLSLGGLAAAPEGSVEFSYSLDGTSNVPIVTAFISQQDGSNYKYSITTTELPPTSLTIKAEFIGTDTDGTEINHSFSQYVFTKSLTGNVAEPTDLSVELSEDGLSANVNCDEGSADGYELFYTKDSDAEVPYTDTNGYDKFIGEITITPGVGTYNFSFRAYVTINGNDYFSQKVDYYNNPVTFASPIETTTITITSSPSTENYGNTITLTASVKDSSDAAVTSGNVTFYYDDTLLGTSDDGIFTFITTALPVGINTITATYNGTTEYAANTTAPDSSVDYTIKPLAPSLRDLTITDITDEKVLATVAFTDAADPGTITSYKLYYSTNSDVSSSTEITTSSDNIKLTEAMPTSSSSPISIEILPGTYYLLIEAIGTDDVASDKSTPASGPINVKATQITLDPSDLSSLTYGRPFTITATVTATVTEGSNNVNEGTVTLYDQDNNELDTKTIETDGTASFTFNDTLSNALSRSVTKITAVYQDTEDQEGTIVDI